MAADSAEVEELFGVDGAAELASALETGSRLCWIEDPPGAAGVALARTAFAIADIRCAAFDLARRPAGVDLLSAMTAAVRRAGLLASGVVVSSAGVLVGTPEAAAVVRLLVEAPVPVVHGRQLPLEPRVAHPTAADRARCSAAAREPDCVVAQGDRRRPGAG